MAPGPEAAAAGHLAQRKRHLGLAGLGCVVWLALPASPGSAVQRHAIFRESRERRKSELEEKHWGLGEEEWLGGGQPPKARNRWST